MNFATPPAKFSKAKPGRTHDGSNGKHCGVMPESAWSDQPGGKLERKAVFLYLRKRSDAGGFMDDKAHHIVRGKYRESSQGQPSTKPTFATIRHGQEHRRINPGK